MLQPFHDIKLTANNINSVFVCLTVLPLFGSLYRQVIFQYSTCHTHTHTHTHTHSLLSLPSCYHIHYLKKYCTLDPLVQSTELVDNYSKITELMMIFRGQWTTFILYLSRRRNLSLQNYLSRSKSKLISKNNWVEVKDKIYSNTKYENKLHKHCTLCIWWSNTQCTRVNQIHCIHRHALQP